MCQDLNPSFVTHEEPPEATRLRTLSLFQGLRLACRRKALASEGMELAPSPLVGQTHLPPRPIGTACLRATAGRCGNAKYIYHRLFLLLTASRRSYIYKSLIASTDMPIGANKQRSDRENAGEAKCSGACSPETQRRLGRGIATEAGCLNGSEAHRGAHREIVPKFPRERE